MPEIIIISGPNGAGKTSFASQYITELNNFVYVNADEIARNLPKHSDYLAGREMLLHIAELTKTRTNFVIETTLASRTYAQKIPQWKALGYKIILFYVRLPSVEHSIYRVRLHVQAGGHNIPETLIRRRFSRSQEYLEELFKPAVDEWYIIDSLEGRFSLKESWEDK